LNAFAAVLVLPCILLAMPRAAAQAPKTVPALIESMLPAAQLPGNKDVPANLDVFRLGWALWDTGELCAGYNGAVAELIKTATTPGLEPSRIYTQVDAQVPCSLPYLAAGGGVHPELQAFFDVVLDSEFSRFDLPGDLPAALGTPGINLLSVQDTVFSPVRDAQTGAVTTWDYPGLSEIVSHFPPPGAWPGLRLIQNIGFANNPGFPVGDYDWAFEHPLISKPGSPEAVTGSDAFTAWVQSDLVDDIVSDGSLVDGGVIDKLLYFAPMSMLYPDVAALLAQSIQERVALFPDALIDYYSVGGEFWFAAPIEANTWPGCTPVDAPCDDDSQLPPALSYYCHLTNCDYSGHSLAHFRSWLADRYGTMAALQAAWNAKIPGGCATIVGCAAVSPLQAVLYPPLGAGPVSWKVIHDDWVAFQAAQLRAARVWQYGVAKASAPDRSMNLYEGDPAGADEAAQLSDGVSLGTFLPATTPLGELPSRVKEIALHGAAYGESVSFPLFGMKQDVAAGPSGPPQDWPTAWLPGTFHEDHARRTLDEFLTLGVHSVGLAYFEAIANWNIKDGLFTHDCPALPGPQDLNMAQCLGAEVDALQDRLAFMAPWRSPLLLHTGTWASNESGADINDYYASPPISTLLSTLADEQVQWAPFAQVDGLDDLWLPATREVLMVAFLPELDAAAVAYDRVWAATHGLHLVLLMDSAKEAQLGLQGCYTLEAPAGGFHLTLLPVPQQAACASPLVHAAFVVEGAAADVTSGALRQAIELADLLATRPLRPVRAESSPGVLAHGVDVSVASDGMNLLVCATNTLPMPQTFALVPALPEPTFKWTFPEGSAPPVPLAQSEALLRYARAAIPANAISSLPQALDQAVAGAVQAVLDLGTIAPTYDVRAAQQLLLRLQQLNSHTQPEKVLAGLLRLRRMPFVRAEAAGPGLLKVSVVGLDRTPVEGAHVQLEFVLQEHARRDGITLTASAPGDPLAGTVTLSIAPPAVAPWDFIQAGKVMPSENLIEVQAQHPAFFSQGSTLYVP
jgi:hypothetical protein